jgi:two-component system sensor histidine kinase/response regulator
MLIDSRIPGVDTFALADRARRLFGPAIVMLTSPSRPHEAARCRDLNVAHATRPVLPAQLAEAVRAALGASPGAQLTRMPTTAQAAHTTPANKIPNKVKDSSPSAQEPPLRILLAEDNLVNQKVAAAILERRGHTVTIACTGVEALAALDREEFDLVLMDAQMPEMDGFEASGAIRDREKASGSGRRLPIIALTANAMSGDRERCLAAGMDGYSSKPIRAEDLFREIERLRIRAAVRVAVED